MNKQTATQAQQQADLIKHQLYHAVGNFLSNTTPLNLERDLADYLYNVRVKHEKELAEFIQFKLSETLPLMEPTIAQLAELSAIRAAKGELSDPALIVASLIHMALIEEKKK